MMELKLKKCEVEINENCIFIHTERGECLYISYYGKKQVVSVVNTIGEINLLMDGKNVHFGNELKELIAPKTELLD